MDDLPSRIRLYGPELRELRRHAGLRQADLAEALGTYQQEVSTVERGFPAGKVLRVIEQVNGGRKASPSTIGACLRDTRRRPTNAATARGEKAS